MISIITAILGLVKGVPPAWSAAMKMLDRPYCFNYADSYKHAGGSFDKRGKNWIEYPEYDGKNNFQFMEVKRDPEFIYLRNVTPRADARWRSMVVRLPVCGGESEWTYGNPDIWTPLYHMWR